MALTEKTCRPCEGEEDKLDAVQADRLLQETPAWTRDGDTIHRDLTFDDFMAAVRFVDRVAAVAEAEGHHPDVLIHDYKKLRITLSTHAIGGLSENDFILAAKIDALLD